jgi:hypothetical protein
LNPDIAFLIEEGILDPSSIMLLYNTDVKKLRLHLIEKINSIIRDMEANSNDLKDFGETALTNEITRALTQSALFTATAESHSNGHVDITIVAPMVNAANFKVKGEAKIWKTPSYALKGFDQLNGYLTGRPDVALFLYYFRGKNSCDDRFKKYIEELISIKGGKNLKTLGRFATTEHIHTSGATIELDHYAGWLPNEDEDSTEK